MPPSSTVPRTVRILLVDDEPIMLRTLVRVLRRAHPDWELAPVSSTTEAMSALQQTSYDVLVTDLELLEGTGEELLAHVKELYPRIVRVVHSGDVDDRRAHPVDELVHLILPKPATSDELLETVEAAVSLAESAAERCSNGD